MGCRLKKTGKTANKQRALDPHKHYYEKGDVVVFNGNASGMLGLLKDPDEDLEMTVVVAVDSMLTTSMKDISVSLSESEKELLESIGYIMWFGYVNRGTFSYVDFCCDLYDSKTGKDIGTSWKTYQKLKSSGIKTRFFICVP